MALTNTAAAVKTLFKAVPTLDDAGKVKNWRLVVEYSINDYKSKFRNNFDIATPSKAPEDYTKAELLALVGDQFDNDFEVEYTTVKVNPKPVTPSVIANFDVDTLK